MRRIGMAGMVVAGMILGIGAGAMQAQSAEWGDLKKNSVFSRGSKIWVVTDAEPQVRQPCRVRSLEADRLVCSERFGKKRRTYRKEDVLAMIEPIDRFYSFRFWLKGTVPGVGLIVAGAAVLSGPGAIAAVVVGSLVVYFVTFAVAFGDNETQEHLLYLQPGKPLPAGLKY